MDSIQAANSPAEIPAETPTSPAPENVSAPDLSCRAHHRARCSARLRTTRHPADEHRGDGHVWRKPMTIRPPAGGSTGANLWVWAVLHVVAEGKMRAIFSLVFGAGNHPAHLAPRSHRPQQRRHLLPAHLLAAVVRHRARVPAMARRYSVSLRSLRVDPVSPSAKCRLAVC
jgi:hypothetical protein